MNSKKLNLPQKYLGTKKLKKKIKLEQDKYTMDPGQSSLSQQKEKTFGQK